MFDEILDDNVTDGDAQAFADVVSGHPSLITFSELPLRDLREDTLSELDCKNRNYGSTQMYLLASMLKKTTKLKYLSLTKDSPLETRATPCPPTCTSSGSR